MMWEHTGLTCEPTGVWLLEQEAHWLLCYGPRESCSNELDMGSMVDGGEVIVTVDCRTREVRFANDS